MENVKAEIVQLERQFWNESGNNRFFEQAIADDALMVIEPMGFIDKAKAIQMNTKAEGWKDVEMKDVHVVELSPDCVAIAYHGQGKMANSGKPYQGAICSVYVKRDGHWQMGVTSHQPWNPESR